MNMNTKEKIITTALKLFLADEYKSVSLNRLLSLLKISKGAFYHYFESKQELYFECIHKLIELMKIDYSEVDNYTLKEFIVNYQKIQHKNYENIINILEIEESEIELLRDIFSTLNNAAILFPQLATDVSGVEQNNTIVWSGKIEEAVKKDEVRNSINSGVVTEMFLSIIKGYPYRNFAKTNRSDVQDELLGLLLQLYELIKESENYNE